MAKYLDENGLSTLWGKITDKVAALKCYDTSASDTAGTWTVTIPGIATLTEGLTIKIRLKTSYNGTTNTLNLNGLGAKIVYFRYGNKLTSHYSKESVLALTYTENAISSGNDRTGWIIENIYDSTNTYQLRKYYTRYKTKSVLYRYMICFVNKDEELIPVNNVSNSTATTKTLTTESFMPSKGIYYYNSTTTVAVANYTGNATLYQQLGLINLQYSFNTGTTLTANKPVYLVVTPQADGQVKLASTPIAQALPTSDTNNLYVFLGTAYDNYRIELPIEHPIYVYRNGYCESLDMSHDRSLDNISTEITTLKSYFDNEGSALYAVNDEDGYPITTTYATKTELSGKADDQLPMEITTTEGDKYRTVGDAIVGINDAMTIMASEIPNYSTATSSVLGLVKLGSDTVQSTTANSVTSTSSRTYAVQKNSNDQLVVNVPWTGGNMKISFNGYVNVGSSTNTSFTKYSSNSLSGGTYGRVYNIFAKSQGSGGGISVQKKATYYTDYDCVAQATANSSFWISLTVFVPANTTYYLYYMLVTNCYWNSFNLTTA